MTNEEFYSIEFPKKWDNSMRTTLRSCPRKLYWFLRGYDYASTPAYFVWGGAFQEGLSIYYDGGIPEYNTPSYTYKTAKALRTAYDYYDANLDQTAEPSPKDSRENLEKILLNYFSERQSEQWHVIKGGAEIGWLWPIEGTPYYMGGSLDARIEWPGYGIMVLETKTTGEYLTKSFIECWDFSTQVTGYIWYLTQLFGEQVFGCLMNLVTKNSPGPRSNWTTPRIARTIIRKTPEQLQEFITDFIYDINQAKIYFESQRWPKTTDHNNCAGGAGRAPCLFKNICKQDKANYTEIDPLAYTGIKLRTEPWEPWKRSSK